MKRDKDEIPKDKAKERMRQFESAREPQATDQELIENLEDLIEQLLAKNEPLTNRAAHKLLQFRNRFFLDKGASHKSNKESEQE